MLTQDSTDSKRNDLNMVASKLVDDEGCGGPNL